MSFILDALRKSDAERQRGAAPGLADVRYATRSDRRSIWVPLLAVVLVANIGFMAWQWYGGRTASPTPVPAESAVEASAPQAAPVSAPEVRALARESESGEPVVAPEVQSDLPDTPITPPTPEPPTAAASPSAAKPPPAPSRFIAAPALPTIEQLIGADTLDLPLLNLDLLVYNESPSVRFVVINGRKYREGARLTEGPTVESITPDGAILADQGQRFTLDRK